MKTSQQLCALIHLALVLTPSFVFAQSPPAAPPAQAGAAAAPVAAAAPAPASPPRRKVVARRPAVERQDAKRPAQRQNGKLTQNGGERPVATFPGFRMLADGGSRVFLQVNDKVDVSESKADGRLVYRLKGVQAIQTNRFPLVTSFFATPVTQVQLIGRGNDLDMVIDVRGGAEPKYTIVESDHGIVLQVDFPRVATEARAPEDAERGRARAGKRRAPAPDTSEPVDDGPTE